MSADADRPADRRPDVSPSAADMVPAVARHLMVDIETLGARPGSVIASIGAVVFDANQIIEEWECLVDPQSCVDVGLKLEVDTIKWWMRQSDDARAKTFGVRAMPVADALNELARWANGVHGCTDYWSHGATFDLVMLHEAHIMAKATPLVKDFRRARDTRTLYEITGVNPKTFMGTGTAHNAVDDARAQALAVIESWRTLRRWKNAATEQASQPAKAFSPWGVASTN